MEAYNEIRGRRPRKILSIFESTSAPSSTAKEAALSAYLDVGDLDKAAALLTSLETEFPNSMRVKMSKALVHESRGELNDAQALYDEIVDADPSHAVARKRLVALESKRGNSSLAIEKLIAYITEFNQSDPEAWSELAGLYVSRNEYANAKFALEEVVLCEPYSYLSHLRLAEALHTLKDYEGALKYACHASLVNPKSVRAAWSAAQASSALLASSRLKKQKKDDEDKTKKMHLATTKHLLDMHAGIDTNVTRALKRLLADSGK